MIWFGGDSKLCKDIKKGLESELDEVHRPDGWLPEALPKEVVLLVMPWLPVTPTSHKF